MRVEYQITDKAVYSDGQPVTCDSFLLAQVAATSRPLFDSYNPLMEQIDTINCQPGNKTATVVFKGNFGPRWRYLFSRWHPPAGARHRRQSQHELGRPQHRPP